jgi:hypothetical protein
MTPDWDALAEQAPIIAALVVGLAKRSRCHPQAVLDTLSELIEESEPTASLRLVADDPQAAA